MRQLHVVPAPKTFYKIWDNLNASFTPYFENVALAADYLKLDRLRGYDRESIFGTAMDAPAFRREHHKALFSDSINLRTRTPFSYCYMGTKIKRYVVLNDWDAVIDPDDVHALYFAVRPYKRRHGSWRRKDFGGVFFTKANPHKIKRQFHHVTRASDYSGDGYTYPYYLGQYRGIQTTHERRANIAHVDEYGQDIVRGRRRKLPSAWDDDRISAWSDLSSWKRNSKRRKQWKPRDLGACID